MEEKQLRTGIDTFLEMVNSEKEMRVPDAAKKLGVPEATIELWAEVLYQDGMIEINYDGFGKMVVTAARKKTESKESAAEAKPKEAGHDSRARKKALGLKAKKGLKLLRKYSMHRDRESGQKGGESIVSKILRALKAPFVSGKKADGSNMAELQKKINELKKMNK